MLNQMSKIWGSKDKRLAVVGALYKGGCYRSQLFHGTSDSRTLADPPRISLHLSSRPASTPRKGEAADWDAETIAEPVNWTRETPPSRRTSSSKQPRQLP